MSSKERMKAEPCAGTLGVCLVDGNPEANARGRNAKRGALAISIALQTAGLAVLVIAPLFAKQPELTARNAMPIPPYTHHAAPRREVSEPPGQPRLQRSIFSAPTRIAPTIVTRDNTRLLGDLVPDGTINLTDADGPAGPLSIPDARPQPVKPEVPAPRTHLISEAHIDPALLTRRIEPGYPPLAQQTRRSGRVELHAIIATDGSIQSLEVVSGDPMFIRSALEAVRQWHYKPTYLNGQPMEIDTYISVIYTVQQ